MSAQESQLQHAWQETQIAGHNIIHAALADTKSGEQESEHMTLDEAASFLGISALEVRTLIKREVLCASPSATTGDYQVDRHCAEAQRSTYMKTVQVDAKNVAGLDDLFSQDGLDGSGPAFTRDEHSDPLTGVTPIRSKALTEEERDQITSKNVATLLDSLDFANIRLEGAMYRVGYLEAQVESLHEQLKVLPELRTRAARAILTDRENDILKMEMTAQKTELEAQQTVLDAQQTGLNAQKAQLDAQKTELDALKEQLARLENSKIFKVCKWAFGLKL